MAEIKKKSRVQAAQEAYEGERANAQKAWELANNDAERATREATQAEVAANVAKVNADKARANMAAEESGKGIREDGSTRKPGKGKYWDKAKADLDRAVADETKAEAQKNAAVSARAAAQGRASELQKKVAEVSDGAVKEARTQESAEADQRMKELGTALAVGAGIGAAAAVKHAHSLYKAAQTLNATLPLANTATPEGRAALAKMKATIDGLKRTGALDAASKAKLGFGIGGAVAVSAFATGYLAGKARDNGMDGLGYALDTLNRVEQGAAIVLGVNALKDSAKAYAGKPLGSIATNAAVSQAEAKVAELEKGAKRAAISKADRAAVKAAKAEAAAATRAAAKAEREARAATRKAEKAAAQAEKSAQAKADKIIADKAKAARAKARADAKIAKGRAEAFDKGKATGSRETRAKVRAAEGQKVAAAKVEAGRAESFKKGVTAGRREGIKVGKATAYREAGVAMDKAAGRVKPGQPLPTQAPAQPRATTKETLGLAKQAQARAATVGRIIASAPTPTTAPGGSGAAITKAASKPAGVKVGGQGKFAFAMTALAVAATAVGAVTAGSGQAEAKEAKRMPYVNKDGEATTGTAAQIANWNRQKGGN